MAQAASRPGGLAELTTARVILPSSAAAGPKHAGTAAGGHRRHCLHRRPGQTRLLHVSGGAEKRPSRGAACRGPAPPHRAVGSKATPDGRPWGTRARCMGRGCAHHVDAEAPAAAPGVLQTRPTGLCGLWPGPPVPCPPSLPPALPRPCAGPLCPPFLLSPVGPSCRGGFLCLGPGCPAARASAGLLRQATWEPPAASSRPPEAPEPLP